MPYQKKKKFHTSIYALEIIYKKQHVIAVNLSLTLTHARTHTNFSILLIFSTLSQVITYYS